MATKTVDDCEASIRDLIPRLQAFPTFHPEFQKIEKQIARQVSKWADLVDIVVYAAKNEQEPWTEAELGLPIKPMKLKSESGFQQTGDYTFTVNGVFASLVIERKGVTRKGGYMQGCDLYGTLFNKSNRERFKKEFARFQADSRLDTFIVIAECSYGEFLSFTPLFNGKKRNVNHIGASVASRVGTIASSEIEGCHVFWAGTRDRAIEFCRSMIRQWIIKHYKIILKL